MTHLKRIATVAALVLVQAEAATNIAGQATQTKRVNERYWVAKPAAAYCTDLTNKLQQDRETWAVFYENYASGFISGANFVSYYGNIPESAVGGGEPGSHTLLRDIEAYCRRKPFDFVQAAVETVYLQYAGHCSSADDRGLITTACLPRGR
jgi:predicted alpha/beta hydrolase